MKRELGRCETILKWTSFNVILFFCICIIDFNFQKDYLHGTLQDGFISSCCNTLKVESFKNQFYVQSICIVIVVTTFYLKYCCLSYSMKRLKTLTTVQ